MYDPNSRRRGHPADPAALVPPGSACPACGEREMDLLVWREDETGVDCLSCGAFYDPNGLRICEDCGARLSEPSEGPPALCMACGDAREQAYTQALDEAAAEYAAWEQDQKLYLDELREQPCDSCGKRQRECDCIPF